MVNVSEMDIQILITPSSKRVAEKILLSIAHKMRYCSKLLLGFLIVLITIGINCS